MRRSLFPVGSFLSTKGRGRGKVLLGRGVEDVKEMNMYVKQWECVLHLMITT